MIKSTSTRKITNYASYSLQNVDLLYFITSAVTVSDFSIVVIVTKF